jgi:hypothetical protein
MNDEKPKTSGWKVIGYTFGGLFAVAAVLDLLAKALNPVGYEQARQLREKHESTRQAAAIASETAPGQTDADSEDRRKGRHCLSKWDGSNRSTVDQIKAQLREPDSFEHIETSIYPNDNGEHGSWIQYRARNGFGGMNVDRMYARIDHETCVARLLPNGPGS